MLRNSPKTAYSRVRKYRIAENDRFNSSYIPQKKVALFNYLLPSEILSLSWEKYGMPDEITYRAYNGGICTIIDENLLSDINDFMLKNDMHGTLPRIYTEGKTSFECYEQPEKEHIISYLKKYINYYDIYDADGNLVKRTSSKQRTILVIEEDE